MFPKAFTLIPLVSAIVTAVLVLLKQCPWLVYNPPQHTLKVPT